MTKEPDESKSLTEYEALKEPMAMGEVFALSGMFPDVKTKAQGAVKILAGRELGLSPFESMKNIYLVNGRLAIMSNALASLVKKSTKYDYQVKSLTDEECTIIFYRIKSDSEKEVLGTSTFTSKDAAKAGLINKDNWKSYPKNMLFARALANGVRWYAPDSACGWHTMEEMTDLEPSIQTEIITISKAGKVEKGEVSNGETSIRE
jgi:hypothetical protein